MINFLIAYDDLDGKIGEYLVKCYSKFAESVNQIEIKTFVSLNGNSCTEEEIKVKVDGFNNNPFIFIGLSHGRPDSLTASQVAYVSFNNASKFQNSFFYTCACLSALQLGPELLKHGCLAFIGYNTEVKVVIRFIDSFIRCKVSGMAFFLQGGKTIEETYLYMISIYEKEINHLDSLSGDGFLAAAFLRSNMTSLIPLGNKELRVEDFIYQ